MESELAQLRVQCLEEAKATAAAQAKVVEIRALLKEREAEVVEVGYSLLLSCSCRDIYI